jgi:hypothetical protein
MKKIYIVLFVCICCVCACSLKQNEHFVETVNTALDTIVPAYNHYVSLDESLNAEQITVIIKSTNELRQMVKEELARIKGE